MRTDNELEYAIDDAGNKILNFNTYAIDTASGELKRSIDEYLSNAYSIIEVSTVPDDFKSKINVIKDQIDNIRKYTHKVIRSMELFKSEMERTENKNIDDILQLLKLNLQEQRLAQKEAEQEQENGDGETSQDPIDTLTEEIYALSSDNPWLVSLRSKLRCFNWNTDEKINMQFEYYPGEMGYENVKGQGRSANVAEYLSSHLNSIRNSIRVEEDDFMKKQGIEGYTSIIGYSYGGEGNFIYTQNMVNNNRENELPNAIIFNDGLAAFTTATKLDNVQDTDFGLGITGSKFESKITLTGKNLPEETKDESKKTGGLGFTAARQAVTGLLEICRDTDSDILVFAAGSNENRYGPSITAWYTIASFEYLSENPAAIEKLQQQGYNSNPIKSVSNIEISTTPETINWMDKTGETFEGTKEVILVTLKDGRERPIEFVVATDLDHDEISKYHDGDASMSYITKWVADKEKYQIASQVQTKYDSLETEDEKIKFLEELENWLPKLNSDNQ